MKTELTVIVDNIADGGLQGEWGLCILAEYGEKKILVDTGASGLFAENMKKLGLDIKAVDCGVLSHAHYDHANGIPRFFEENKTAPFYLRAGTAEDCYFHKFIFHKYIGIPKNMGEKYGDRIEYVTGNYSVADGVFLIPHSTAGLSEIGKREMMYRRTKGGWVPDDFSHEQSLVLDTEKGLVIINCCSHGGAVNIINEVKSAFPDKEVYGLIGGFHLFNKKEAEVRAVAGAIRDTGISFVCTGHCTKDRAYGVMKEILGESLTQLKVGLKMSF